MILASIRRHPTLSIGLPITANFSPKTSPVLPSVTGSPGGRQDIFFGDAVRLTRAAHSDVWDNDTSSACRIAYRLLAVF
jgi:hypothetical protein